MFVCMLDRLFSQRVNSLSIARRAVFCLVGFAANVFLLSGCVGSVNGEKPAGSTQAAAGASQTPKIVVTPNALTFQNVIVGQKNTQTVQISNAGNANLDVSSISLTGAGFSLGSITVPLQIAPGANKSFTVSFAPAAATSSAKATVSIASNDGVSPTDIAVQGTAVKAGPSWEISTGALTFSGVTVQSSQSQNVVLSNNGNVAVTINSVAVVGNGFSTSGGCFQAR